MKNKYGGKNLTIKKKVVSKSEEYGILSFSGTFQYFSSFKNLLSQIFFPKWKIETSNIDFEILKENVNVVICLDPKFLNKLEEILIPRTSSSVKIEGKTYLPDKKPIKINLKLLMDYNRKLSRKDNFYELLTHLKIHEISSVKKKQIWNKFHLLITKKLPKPFISKTKEKRLFLEALSVLGSRIILITNYSSNLVFDIQLLSSLKKKYPQLTLVLFSTQTPKNLQRADNLIIIREKKDIFSDSPIKLSECFSSIQGLDNSMIEIKGSKLDYKVLTILMKFDWVKNVFYYVKSPINSGKIFIEIKNEKPSLNTLLKVLSINDVQIKSVGFKELNPMDYFNLVLRGDSYHE